MRRTLLTASAVYAGDPPRPAGDALVIEGDRVGWVGPREEAPRPVPRARHDVGDGVVVPGFVDAHLHLSHLALMPGWTDLSPARSAGEVITRLRRAAPDTPPGAWIVGTGYGERLLAAMPRLLRAHLDRVHEERPVLVMHRNTHSGVANSAALAAVGFGRSTPRWPGGELERDLTGEPNGRAWERAYGVLEAAARRAELEALGTGWFERMRAVAGRLLAAGITAAVDAAATPRELDRLVQTELPLRVTAMPVGPGGFLATPRAALSGPVTGEVAGGVRIGNLKLVADGAERCALRLRFPLATRAARALAFARQGPGPVEALRILQPHVIPGGVRTGTMHYSPQALREMVVSGAARGFGVAIHAIGNEAVRAALDALEGAPGEGHRIEHAMFAEGGHAERMARLGVTAVVQPGHLGAFGELIRAAQLDAELPPVPLRRLLDAGVAVGLSSDAPSVAPDPLAAMALAVTRRVRGGEVAPDQAIGEDEALRAATVGAARAAGYEDAGTLTAGTRADLAVLSGRPLDQELRVMETWVAGERAFPGPLGDVAGRA